MTSSTSSTANCACQQIKALASDVALVPLDRIKGVTFSINLEKEKKEAGYFTLRNPDGLKKQFPMDANQVDAYLSIMMCTAYAGGMCKDGKHTIPKWGVLYEKGKQFRFAA
jgi:hypothetical protein